jgi:hypothetical protein
MKVGRGQLDLMSKINRKRKYHGHSSFLYTPILAVLMLSVILIGCGNISLNELLEKQAPGELGITPKSATIDKNCSIAIAGKGGFMPYTFSATAGTFDEIDGVTYYTAPDSVTNVTIKVVDGFSNEATASIGVIDSATGLNFPAAMTIAVGESTGYIMATGGVQPYTFWLEGSGLLDFHDVLSDRVKYRSMVGTTDIIYVEDSDTPPTQRTLTITVAD